MTLDLTLTWQLSSFICRPSCLGIIRVGSKLRKPDWIEEVDWNYLNSSIDYPHRKIIARNRKFIHETVSTTYHLFSTKMLFIYLIF